jgi:esterase/lipase superfamily enzyme
MSSRTAWAIEGCCVPSTALRAQAQGRTGKPFGQIILAAADVDADVFRQLSAAYAQVANRTTL